MQPALIKRLQRQESLNFWLTNRIPRNLLSRVMGRVSRIENRQFARLAIALWQRFADDLRLDEAETREFDSIRACFTRRLKPEARPVDPDPNLLVSPCDAVIGAFGTIESGQLLQAKGMVYRLADLLGDAELARAHEGGVFATLRLKSSMYHRFHAPCIGRVRRLDVIAGERYNVNPPAVRRIPGLFCINRRAVVRFDNALGLLTLVPVAAILVSSMRFSFLDPVATDGADSRRVDCNATFGKGDELGWFEHGSTLIVLGGPEFDLVPELGEGRIIRMGQPLLAHRV